MECVCLKTKGFKIYFFIPAKSKDIIEHFGPGKYG